MGPDALHLPSPVQIRVTEASRDLHKAYRLANMGPYTLGVLSPDQIRAPGTLMSYVDLINVANTGLTKLFLTQYLTKIF